MTILHWKISIHFSLLNSLMLAKYFDKIYAGARNLANMVIQELNACQSFHFWQKPILFHKTPLTCIL